MVLLGRFAVRIDGRELPPDAWKRRRGAETVKILALSDERRLHREQLMHAMWPDLDPPAAAANLRKAIHFARHALGAEAIANHNGVIALLPGADVSIDATTFEVAARTAVASGDAAQAAAAAGLYTGDLLPDDRYASWADEPRQCMRLLAVRVMKQAEQWERVIALDAADEDAHRALMQRALDAGDRTRAIRQFGRLRERLRIDLGVGPSGDTVALYEQAIFGADEKGGAQQVRTLLARAFVDMNRGQLTAAEHNADLARRLAVAHGLAVEFKEATAMLSIMSSLQNRWTDLFRAEFAEALSGSDADADQLFDAHVCVTEYHLHGPSGLDGLDEFAGELATAAERAGSVRGQAVSELLAGEARLFAGDVTAAESHLIASLRLHQQAGAPGAGVVARQRLADCLAKRGDVMGARNLLDDGLSVARRSPLAPHLITRMHEGLVRWAESDDVRRAIQAAATELDGSTTCPPCAIGFWIEAARRLLELGDIDTAGRYLERADQIAASWTDGAWHAAVLEVRGLAAQAVGDAAAAVEMLTHAADRYAQVGRYADESRCRQAATKSDLAPG